MKCFESAKGTVTKTYTAKGISILFLFEMNGTILKYLKAVPLSKKFLCSLWTFLNNSEKALQPPPSKSTPISEKKEINSKNCTKNFFREMKDEACQSKGLITVLG